MSVHIYWWLIRDTMIIAGVIMGGLILGIWLILHLMWRERGKTGW